AFEINLAIAKRPEPSGPLRPRLIPAVDTHSPARSKLGVLDVKPRNALPVKLDEFEVIELLQQQMTRVVIDARGGMVVGVFEEEFKRGAVEEVGAGMQLIAEDAAVVVGHVEKRLPAAGQFREALVDQTGRPLRPGIGEMPGETTRQHRNVPQ